MRYRTMLGVVSLVAALGGSARAEDEDTSPSRRRAELSWIPGAAREVAHSSSASRDTGAVAVQLSPYLSATVGGDLAIAALRLPDITWRLGFFGLIELESSDPLAAGSDGFWGIFPADAVILWRGQYGGSLGVSLDSLARRWLPPGGALEVTLSFRHESEHFTGSSSETGGRWAGVPDIGNFLMYDVAARVPAGPLDIEARVQLKMFMPIDGATSYTYGPGLDAVLRWRASERALPFLSVFFEYLVGGERADDRDNHLLRALLGVLLPGRAADVQLFTSLVLGHGKGLLEVRDEFLWGAGLRIVWPPGR
jgi:hypothetical protein